MPPYSKQFGVFFRAQNVPKLFSARLCPRPLGELTEYDAPPDLLIGWGGGPLPILLPFDAFAVFDLPEGVGRV